MDFEEFMTAISKAQWQLNYHDFCARAGFSEDDYSEGKWRTFQELVRNLNQFDPRTLEKIVLSPEALKAQEAERVFVMKILTEHRSNLSN